MHKLEVKDLKKTIKKSEIIKGISLEVNSGEVVGLLGPNGAGKTTTFYMICGLISPTSGDVFLNDEKITNVPLHKRAHLGIGYLPQESSIFKELSVEENLLLGAEILNQSKEEISKRVNEMLNMLNIEPIRLRKGVS
ncbi:MAG: ATP-binding cassette domain-containing protein, partial [Campylobacter sp.]|nr:ATP-binding cassette domain-containing protein [Campylobacter sp.]